MNPSDDAVALAVDFLAADRTVELLENANFPGVAIELARLLDLVAVSVAEEAQEANR